MSYYDGDEDSATWNGPPASITTTLQQQKTRRLRESLRDVALTGRSIPVRTVASQQLVTISLHSTISKDNTAGEEARRADLFAHLGHKTRNCVYERGETLSELLEHSSEYLLQFDRLRAENWHQDRLGVPRRVEWEDELREAGGYQDEVTGIATPPLTAEFLRQQSESNGPRSHAVRSSARHDETDPNGTPSTGRYSHDDGDEDITIRVKGAATLTVGGTERVYQDGDVIDRGQWNPERDRNSLLSYDDQIEATPSNEILPHAEKGRKERSTRSSSWTPKVSRWSETTTSSIGKAFRNGGLSRDDGGSDFRNPPSSGSDLASDDEYNRISLQSGNRPHTGDSGINVPRGSGGYRGLVHQQPRLPATYISPDANSRKSAAPYQRAPDEIVYCGVCQRMFSNNPRLQRHIKRKHKPPRYRFYCALPGLDPSDVPLRTPLSKCEACVNRMLYDNYLQARAHISSHFTKRPISSGDDAGVDTGDDLPRSSILNRYIFPEGPEDIEQDSSGSEEDEANPNDDLPSHFRSAGAKVPFAIRGQAFI